MIGASLAPAMKTEKRRSVIACLHDVTPKHFDRLIEIDDFYRRVGIGSRYAMLVVPDFGGHWRLTEFPDFCAWLRDRAEKGVELFLHGFYHKDFTPAAELSPRLRLQYQLLGEGEFAALSFIEARTRIENGRRILEEALETKVDAFVAPAWQYSAGARAALKEMGFRIAEDRSRVWNPATGETLTQTPVIAYSGRSSVRRELSIGWSQAATRLMEAARVVRHALHPQDFDSVRLADEIERSLSELVRDRDVAPYRSLLGEGRVH